MAGSQNDLQTGMYNAVRKFRHAISNEIDTAFLAKIVKYDRSRHVADVQPLANASNGMKSAQFLELPVAESCYMLDEWFDRIRSEFSKLDSNSYNGTSLAGKFPSKRLLRPGVPVVCIVLDRDMDNWDGKGSTFDPNTGRMHDANDSVVIAVLGGNASNG